LDLIAFYGMLWDLIVFYVHEKGIIGFNVILWRFTGMLWDFMEFKVIKRFYWIECGFT
jgi:hypothetical protein